MGLTRFFFTALLLAKDGHSFSTIPRQCSEQRATRLGASEKLQQQEEEVKLLENEEIFDRFATFLRDTQQQIIAQLEALDGSGERFSTDAWGLLNTTSEDPPKVGAGGITRVIQGGNVVEKGACSLTIIRNGILSAERAAAIRSRQPKETEDEEDGSEDDDFLIGSGDFYSAAALSIVLHSRSPMVPTFRSDVRIFLVQDASAKDVKRPVMAWFGGGADLTPYYLFEEDVKSFHKAYRDLCEQFGQDYEVMKSNCDRYFYLPARAEHRGTGGIFFDDMEADEGNALQFVMAVANAWMPSWIPIVEKRQPLKYTKEQKQWQKIRRGRYLEFNLLYDRGVKFGLQTANPRVEGVMVSAPPEIAFEYNHIVEPGSEEAKIMQLLKNPIDWI